LIGTSKIINDKTDENFIRALFSKKIQLALLYRASEHNFQLNNFISYVTTKEQHFVFLKVRRDEYLAVYSDKSWFSELQFKASKEAFLFSIHYKKKMNLY
jgi:hypothetical protein